MKVALLVILGVAIAAFLTFKYQPQYFTRFPSLPLPNIIVTSPRSGQKVGFSFTVTGFVKSPPVPLIITDSSNREIYSTTVSNSNFTQIIDLSSSVQPGDKINLTLGSSTDLVSIPLTILKP